MIPLLRTRYRVALGLLLILCVFRSTDLHAAWNWTFPFYHAEVAPAPSAPPAPAPAPPAPTQPPAETKPVSTRSTEPLPLITISTSEVKPPEVVPTTPAVAEPGNGEGQPPAEFADAQRLKGEMVREDTLWQGNVQLDGWVTVAPQATLTLSPGTVVRLGKGSGIHVLGRIVVRGDADNPVLITSLSRVARPGEWHGIVLSGSEKNNILENVRIDGAETALLTRFSNFTARGVTISRSLTGMQLQECVASITASRITACGSGIVAGNSELTLEGVTLEQNRSGIVLSASSLLATNTVLNTNITTGLTAEGSHVGLDRFTVSGSESGARITRGEGFISSSSFHNNSDAGLVLAGSRLKLTNNLISNNRIGLQCDDHLPVLWSNALVDNKGYNLLYLGEEKYYAGGNWFGDDTRENSEKTVFSKHFGTLQIEPLLTENPRSDK